ncbi:OmpA family protein [Acinetobacter equi]|uniref:OmpA-like domain-containing protein n=1 Tax=Acinetobacter equi TaxID=1324350 RepID=A0A0N9VF08_9GAMM|nr:hypothetical protein AOY20_10055 [Acinetobacter equi]
MKNNIKKDVHIVKKLSILFGMLITTQSFANPIVIEGVVPDQASKTQIINKLKETYGDTQIVDKILVRPVVMPKGWIETVTQSINPDLKKVSQGKLVVQGTQVKLSGKVSNEIDKTSTEATIKNGIQPTYRFSSTLSLNLAEQKILDDALKNRIIEFESGSAVLTAAGQQILNEMAAALNKVKGKNIKIIGHTDSSGDPKKNIILSQQRADAVKQYLIEKQIPSDKLATEGLGAQKPVADNTTAEGRKKNRRIEFEVL